MPECLVDADTCKTTSISSPNNVYPRKTTDIILSVMHCALHSMKSILDSYILPAVTFRQFPAAALSGTSGQRGIYLFYLGILAIFPHLNYMLSDH